MTAGRPVALLVHELRGGGAEQVMAHLASALAAKGLSVDLVAMRAVGPNRDRVGSAVRLVDLNAPRIVRSVRPLVGYLRERRPVTLLSALAPTNIAATVAVGLAGTDTRLVVSEHSCPGYARRYGESWQVRAAHRLSRWAYRRADAIVAVSEGVAEEVARHCRVGRERVRRIYNPVVPGNFASLVGERPAHPWLNGEATPVIVAAGRLAPVKDFSTLIRAVAVVRRHTPVRLIILGEGPMRGDLIGLGRSLELGEAMDLPGYVGNAYPWLAAASVVAVSSVSESFGNVIVEAMACATPVVSTDCPSGPAEILDRGRYGRLVPPGDAAALAEGLTAALADPGDLGAAQQRAGAFTVERIVAEYLDVLDLERCR